MRLKDITDKLNAAQIMTGTGKKWTVNILSRLMHNEKLIGVINADEQYTHIVPAIIDEETFKTAIAKLDLNKHRAGVFKAPIQYLLSGKVECGHCKTLMTGDSGTSKTAQYIIIINALRKRKTAPLAIKSQSVKSG